MIGSYTIDVQPGRLPQKIASAFDDLLGNLVGADYTPIAYLGSKVVEGINHAVLAGQVLTTGNDIHNVVLIIFHEKPVKAEPDEHRVEVVEIRSLVSDGGQLGGLNVSPTLQIPVEAKEAFNKSLFGSKVVPFALLATQMVNGAKYVFAAETQMVVSPTAIQEGNTKRVCLVTVHANDKDIDIAPFLEGVPSGNLLQAGASSSLLVQWP